MFTQLLPGKDFDGALYVAVALLRRGEPGRAERIIEATEHTARSTSRNVDEHALLNWIDVMTDFDDVDRAEPLVHTLQDPEVPAAAWQRLAEPSRPRATSTASTPLSTTSHNPRRNSGHAWR
ncbi:MAG TPA: hypothetical protein VF821_35630 [Lentzea sp.]